MRPQENIRLGRVTAAVKKSAEAAAEAAEQASTPQNAAAAAGKAGAASLGSSLASLPASLTSFLLSIVDSPAYGNLTTALLSGQFNADTPDDPRVRYFSVAARAPSANVWHPLWLPKLVLDGAEKRARAAAAAARDPRAAVDAEWGNDGLVSVQSGRWGRSSSGRSRARTTGRCAARAGSSSSSTSRACRPSASRSRCRAWPRGTGRAGSARGGAAPPRSRRRTPRLPPPYREMAARPRPHSHL
jgi:hypothetical protein